MRVAVLLLTVQPLPIRFSVQCASVQVVSLQHFISTEYLVGTDVLESHVKVIELLSLEMKRGAVA